MCTLNVTVYLRTVDQNSCFYYYLISRDASYKYIYIHTCVCLFMYLYVYNSTDLHYHPCNCLAIEYESYTTIVGAKSQIKLTISA